MLTNDVEEAKNTLQISESPPVHRRPSLLQEFLFLFLWVKSYEAVISLRLSNIYTCSGLRNEGKEMNLLRISRKVHSSFFLYKKGKAAKGNKNSGNKKNVHYHCQFPERIKELVKSQGHMS